MIEYTEEDYVIDKLAGKVWTKPVFVDGDMIFVSASFADVVRRKEMVAGIKKTLSSAFFDKKS